MADSRATVARTCAGEWAQSPLVALKRAHPARYPFLLESTTAGHNARYSILFAFPGETLSLTATLDLHRDGTPCVQTDFLSALDTAWQREKTLRQDTALPFRGGWFVYLGYELAAQIEQLPIAPAESALPVAFATRIPAALVYDHVRRRVHAVAERDDVALLTRLCADCEALGRHPQPPPPPRVVTHLQEDAPDQYLQAVRQARRYIHAGDVFQVNLARRWQATLAQSIHLGDIYARLREANPAPFSGWADCAGGAIISSSPERLVRVSGDRVDTRPIAGTRARLADAHADARQIERLVVHPKERAEHVMLIDLERNDLGRIAQPGSVYVDELMTTESYAHVHHIVSNVSARRQPQTTPGDIIRAVFPGGTITGCPKVRCMEIIAELEGVRRGAYTGAMGYINRDGDMDLNILIRTLVADNGTLSLRAGAGIVADSVPEHELAETRAKARGLLAALTDKEPIS